MSIYICIIMKKIFALISAIIIVLILLFLLRSCKPGEDSGRDNTAEATEPVEYVRPAESEASQPISAKPIINEPESIKPESVKPESVKPESVKPESVKPESVKPESVKPEPDFGSGVKLQKKAAPVVKERPVVVERTESGEPEKAEVSDPAIFISPVTVATLLEPAVKTEKEIPVPDSVITDKSKPVEDSAPALSEYVEPQEFFVSPKSVISGTAPVAEAVVEIPSLESALFDPSDEVAPIDPVSGFVIVPREESRVYHPVIVSPDKIPETPVHNTQASLSSIAPVLTSQLIFHSEESSFIPYGVTSSSGLSLMAVSENFLVSTKEITFDRYDIFCDVSNRTKPSDSGWGRGRRPVINVSWYDSVAFCNWLSLHEGFIPAYEWNGVDYVLIKISNGYRLPSADEWLTAFGEAPGYMEYYAWFSENSGKQTWNTGTLKPNSMGLYDMAGNVWEWCFDSYNERSPIQIKEIRGGSWSDSRTYMLPINGEPNAAEETYNNVGFRVVRSI